MIPFIALLRAVNVGGTGKLPMSALKAMCVEEGYEQVQTYIASGNVIFASAEQPLAIQTALERRLLAYLGKACGVIMRTSMEMGDILATNPFPDAAPNHTMVILLNEAPPADAFSLIRGKKDEEVRLGNREIYVHYPAGAGQSKLIIPAAKLGTARNINTITKLVELASKLVLK